VCVLRAYANIRRFEIGRKCEISVKTEFEAGRPDFGVGEVAVLVGLKLSPTRHFYLSGVLSRLC
jgi:hypothetical protein